MVWLIWESCRGPPGRGSSCRRMCAGARGGCGNARSRVTPSICRHTTGAMPPRGSIRTTSGWCWRWRFPWRSTWHWWTADWRAGCTGRRHWRSVCAVVLTASRTALIATFVAFGFAVWTWRRAGPAAAHLDRAARVACSSLALSASPRRRSGRGWRRSLREVATRHAPRPHAHLEERAEGLQGPPALGVGAGAYPEAVRPWLGRPAAAGLSVRGPQYVPLGAGGDAALVGFGILRR